MSSFGMARHGTSRIPTRGTSRLGSPARSVVKTTHPCAGLASQSTTRGFDRAEPGQDRRTAATFVDSTASCVARWEHPASASSWAGWIIRQTSQELISGARGPTRLPRWYADHLGRDPPPATYEQRVWWQQQGPTVFAPIPADTDHFGRQSRRGS
jgi:hypothetical protein